MVSHAGSRLLADLADATALTSAFSGALYRLRPDGTGQGPGRVAVDLAVMPADGGEAVAALAVLRDQRDVFGPVASTATAWRVLAGIGTAALNALRAARARAREAAWLQADETGNAVPAAQTGGGELPGLVLDTGATLVSCHCEKEQATATC
ncbi:IS1380 family transposase, partial [Streptomyces vinaceus]